MNVTSVTIHVYQGARGLTEMTSHHAYPGPNGGLWTDSFANFKLILKLNERFSKVKREKTHLSPSYYYQLKDDEIPVN